jgi:hypothetical protein
MRLTKELIAFALSLNIQTVGELALFLRAIKKYKDGR